MKIFKCTCVNIVFWVTKIHFQLNNNLIRCLPTYKVPLRPFEIILPGPSYKASPTLILSHITKLFEKLVLNNILILIDEQYGFRPDRSSVMNLLVLNNFIIEAFENKCQVDVIFMDFIKAFDRVDHNILLRVLRKSGFGDPLLSWFRSYLLGRFQLVKINGYKSIVSPIPIWGSPWWTPFSSSICTIYQRY
jgi:hypothetical protein